MRLLYPERRSQRSRRNKWQKFCSAVRGRSNFWHKKGGFPVLCIWEIHRRDGNVRRSRLFLTMLDCLKAAVIRLTLPQRDPLRDKSRPISQVWNNGPHGYRMHCCFSGPLPLAGRWKGLSRNSGHLGSSRVSDDYGFVSSMFIPVFIIRPPHQRLPVIGSGGPPPEDVSRSGNCRRIGW